MHVTVEKTGMDKGMRKFLKFSIPLYFDCLLGTIMFRKRSVTLTIRVRAYSQL